MGKVRIDVKENGAGWGGGGCGSGRGGLSVLAATVGNQLRYFEALTGRSERGENEEVFQEELRRQRTGGRKEGRMSGWR